MSGRRTHRRWFSAESQLLLVEFEGKSFGVRLRVEVERRRGVAGAGLQRSGAATSAQRCGTAGLQRSGELGFGEGGCG